MCAYLAIVIDTASDVALDESFELASVSGSYPLDTSSAIMVQRILDRAGEHALAHKFSIDASGSADSFIGSDEAHRVAAALETHLKLLGHHDVTYPASLDMRRSLRSIVTFVRRGGRNGWRML